MKTKRILAVLLGIVLIGAVIVVHSFIQRQRQLTLSAAASTGDIATVEHCVDAGVDLDASPQDWESDEYGIPALTCAALYGHEEVVHYLLNHGANPNRRGMSNPLIAACWKHHYGIAKLLLEHGADPNARGEGTPLLAAEEQPELTELLHKYGAKEWRPQSQ